jgi:hypothetical protein
MRRPRRSRFRARSAQQQRSRILDQDGGGLRTALAVARYVTEVAASQQSGEHVEGVVTGKRRDDIRRPRACPLRIRSVAHRA